MLNEGVTKAQATLAENSYCTSNFWPMAAFIESD
jgi:hypothetical protein